MCVGMMILFGPPTVGLAGYWLALQGQCVALRRWRLPAAPERTFASNAMSAGALIGTYQLQVRDLSPRPTPPYPTLPRPTPPYPTLPHPTPTLPQPYPNLPQPYPTLPPPYPHSTPTPPPLHPHSTPTPPPLHPPSTPPSTPTPPPPRTPRIPPPTPHPHAHTPTPRAGSTRWHSSNGTRTRGCHRNGYRGDRSPPVSS